MWDPCDGQGDGGNSDSAAGGGSPEVHIFRIVTVNFSLYTTAIFNNVFALIFSHFRQLHTTTNLLLLSLAVSDFLVGLLQMPSEFLLFRGCWILGDLICGVNYFFGYLIVSVSVGNMVLISIDRYVAICDPMFYNTKVTLRRIQLCICLCWIFSAVHSTWILRDFLKQHHLYDSCYGECLFISNFVEEIVDLVVTFLGPILIIILLYLRTVKAKKSEMKAARTLGVVVVVFILCSCPYYCVAIAAVSRDNISLHGLQNVYIFGSNYAP
uniref:G-protein coupled receptors family 1 profile domain-containing protein n=1 Tax=Seriola lalandi dorsalis TaxID=1841481 RepID=A0A3B4ZDQ7_SERLL